MALKIRLARRGSKKRPFYHVVLADSRMPRDGRYLEKLGTYNPLLPKDSEERVQVNMERVKHWLGEGAQPTDRVARFLEASGELDKKERNNPKKGTPGKAATDRAEARAAKLEAAKEKVEEVVENVKEAVEEAVEAVEEKIEEIKEKAEEAKEEKAAEAEAEEAKAEEAPAEEAKAEE